ncbi:MAG: hypothetical protein AVDCRST_MAG87-2556 [uncultured Thermomicrobiales bacterium]|uniref:B3/B4 tRNA-binding domain-containing protein n=1 Tax=uncultured Thermomicrobiales bacterium TaxID=1645740 RepID=A0A6J4VDD2_9BACT|nr:MAG: hypothetical protein AVDCRST_MAG87-2556 [uncultured Thermomicrobiales bacterium]
MPSLSEMLRDRLDTVEVEAGIFERWPEYRVLAIVAEGLQPAVQASQATGESTPLDGAEALVRGRAVADWTRHPHVADWMAAYADFGAKPKRTSPSVLALLKRVEAGLPRIDPVTDLYNAVSIAHALPIGGEDLDAYAGAPRLALATGSEPFDTIDNGEPKTDYPATGEVIWRDNVGVTCRRWNWRQGVRTRILPTTTNALFLLEALGALPDDELKRAGDELMDGLRAISPDVAFGRRLIGPRTGDD